LVIKSLVIRGELCSQFHSFFLVVFIQMALCHWSLSLSCCPDSYRDCFSIFPSPAEALAKVGPICLEVA
jgi:hypothetical protein